MGLVGNKADKQARRDAAEARSNRLAALSPRELAAEVMPAFGADGINAPVIEALALLEHANLLSRSSFGSSGTGSMYRATRQGETALADDTVAQQLGT
jgi:hypothetical protein